MNQRRDTANKRILKLDRSNAELEFVELKSKIICLQITNETIKSFFMHTNNKEIENFDNKKQYVNRTIVRIFTVHRNVHTTRVSIT